MADGARHALSYIVEESYGVCPTTPLFTPIRHRGLSGGLSKDTFMSETIRDDRQIEDMRHGAKKIAFDIPIELSYTSFDDLIEATLGGTWAANVLKAGTTRRSFTIESKFADVTSGGYHRFLGCVLNTMQLQINANAMVTGSFGVIGQDITVADGIVAGATYNDPATTSPFDAFTGTIEEGGASIGVVTELSLNLDNGVTPRFVIGSDLTLLPSWMRSTLTGQVTAYFEDSTMLNKFINETESSIEVALEDLAGNTITILLPRIKYTGGPVNVQGFGPITIALPFTALYDAYTEESQITITRAAA
jgi:hypothetical protein